MVMERNLETSFKNSKANLGLLKVLDSTVCCSLRISILVCLAYVLKCTDICTLKECQIQVEGDEEIDLYNSDDD